MAVTLSNIRMGRLEADPGHVVDAAPLVVVVADAVFDNSYATGGELFSPTLDSFFSDVTQFFSSDNSGIALEFVDNATLTSAKLKALQAEGSHSHTLAIDGGGALASTLAVVYATDDDKLEKASEKTIRGSQAGQASYTTGGQTLDLSADFNGIPEVMADMQAVGDFVPRYIRGTNAADGKMALIVPSTGVEVANTTNVSAQTVRYIARGPVTNTGNVDVTTATASGNTADEIAAAQDISTITFSVMITGKPKVQS